MQQVLQDKILSSDVPIVIFVKHTKCGEQHTLETQLEKIFNEKSIKAELIALCYPPERIPFPMPQWNMFYLFEPKNVNYIISIFGDNFIRDFDEVWSGLEAHMSNIPIATFKAQKENPEKIEQIREMLEKEDINKFPSAFQMARNALKQAWDSTKGVIQTGQLLVKAEEANKRLGICEGCEFFKDKRCTQCGCFMEQKVHLEAASCPKSKW